MTPNVTKIKCAIFKFSAGRAPTNADENVEGRRLLFFFPV